VAISAGSVRPLAILALWWRQVASGQPIHSYFVRTSDDSVAITITAQLVLFTTLIGIGLPTMLHSFQTETNPALRLRLLALVSTQVTASVMTGVVITLHCLILYDLLPRDYHSSAVTLLMGLTAGVYGLSVLPAGFYNRLVFTVRYVRQLWQVHRVRQLELETATLLGHQPQAAGIRDTLRAPDYVLYTLVIAILDRRKFLHINLHPGAKAIAVALDELSPQATNYPALVRRLQRGLARR